MSGTIMSGVSAGAICWFESGLTDSWEEELKLLPCLGFVKGTCVPHYDEEPERRPTTKKLLLEGVVSSMYGIEGGAALHIIDGKPIKSVCFENEKFSYLVSPCNNESLDERKLKVENLVL